MTDHYAIVNPEELHGPELPLSPEELTVLAMNPDAKFQCVQCGKEFDTKSQLTGHMNVHVDKVPCPECGMMCVPGVGIARHRQTKHGLATAAGNAHKKYDPKERVQCPECGRFYGRKDLLRHRRAAHGVEASSRPPVVKPIAVEPEWHVDDIFNVVIDLMWPKGEIPVRALNPIVRWRDATQQMLNEVRGE